MHTLARPHARTPHAQVLREVRSVYRTVSEGIINLTDKFFDMERADALRALEMYKVCIYLCNTYVSPMFD